jgi:hypothetical protein
MSVDISNAGSAVVAGNSNTTQSLYVVPQHNATINEVIATADASFPRIDQIILRVYDHQYDSTGNNFARTEVLTGTPTSGATLANRNGAASLSVNSIRLADILVGAGVTSITNGVIKDRRPKTRGKSIISGTESRTSTSYITMPTADQVNEIVVPTDALLAIAFQGAWQQSNASTAFASIFIGANQLKGADTVASGPLTCDIGLGTAVAQDNVLASGPGGLVSFGTNATPYTGDVTTGQVIGTRTGTVSSGSFACGVCYVFVAAGTYDVSVQTKSSAGSVTMKNRKLWVWSMDPAMAVLS